MYLNLWHFIYSPFFATYKPLSCGAYIEQMQITINNPPFGNRWPFISHNHKAATDLCCDTKHSIYMQLHLDTGWFHTSLWGINLWQSLSSGQNTQKSSNWTLDWNRGLRVSMETCINPTIWLLRTRSTVNVLKLTKFMTWKHLTNSQSANCSSHIEKMYEKLLDWKLYRSSPQNRSNNLSGFLLVGCP